MSAHTPAFPVSAYNRGMTLRDWFASQFASAAVEHGIRGYSHLCEETMKRTAEHAYALADAMLLEREKSA